MSHFGSLGARASVRRVVRRGIPEETLRRVIGVAQVAISVAFVAEIVYG